jgi:Flp pilus assembly protein TadG
MHTDVFSKRRARRGLAIALVALLLPVILGVLGLCIDTGVLIVARAHLVTAADAGALAGAYQLNDPGRIAPNFDLSNDIAAARAQALAIGQANTVLGKKAVLNDNPSNDPAGDVVIGYVDVTTPHTQLVTGSASPSTFNSVQVRAQRTGDHGGLVPSFFSKVIGFGDRSLVVQSTATVQNYAINGFRCSPSGLYTKMIPIALSSTTYNAMLSKSTTDNYTFKPKTAQVLGGPDGLYESSLYPVSSGAGNWGTLRVGVNNNGTPTLASQIQKGLTTDDIRAGFGCSMQLNPTLQSPGNPGVSLGLKPALQSLVGKTVIVPIYDPARTTGTGANLQYTIVKFAAVAVLYTYFNGVHSGVIVQPVLTSDTTAVLGPAQSSWTTGGIVRLHLSL